MKTSIICIITALLLIAVPIHAEMEIPIQNEQLTLSGNSLNLKFDLAGPVSGREAKILYGDKTLRPWEGFDENTTIQPYSFWYQRVETGKTTIQEMLIEGWDLRQIFWLSKDQAYFYFIR
jgi:hypothetical protein